MGGISNVITHRYGYRNFNTNDYSTNNKLYNFTTLPLSPSNSNSNIELYLKNFYSYKEKIIYNNALTY